MAAPWPRSIFNVVRGSLRDDLPELSFTPFASFIYIDGPNHEVTHYPCASAAEMTERTQTEMARSTLAGSTQLMIQRVMRQKEQDPNRVPVLCLTRRANQWILELYPDGWAVIQHPSPSPPRLAPTFPIGPQ